MDSAGTVVRQIEPEQEVPGEAPSVTEKVKTLLVGKPLDLADQPRLSARLAGGLSGLGGSRGRRPVELVLRPVGSVSSPGRASSPGDFSGAGDDVHGRA